MKNFWFVTLCFFLIVANNTGMNIFLRIAIGANAILILLDVIKQIWRLKNGRNQEEENNNVI